MAIDATYPHIEKQPDQPACLKRLPRVRIAQIVMDYLAYGWSADEMCRQHPDLTRAEAHAAMTYYFDHQTEVDAEIQSEYRDAEASAKQASDSPIRLRLREQGLL